MTTTAKVIVQHLVTFDGERGHPMDVALTVIELDDDGAPTEAAIARLVERITRDIRSKAVRGPGMNATTAPERGELFDLDEVL